MKSLMVVVAAVALSASVDVTSAMAQKLSQKEKAALETAVKDKLKDPDSAKFKWQDVSLTQADYPKVFKYCGFVNAKNSYGGYIGFQAYYAVVGRKEDGGVLAVVFGMGDADPNSVDSITVRQMCAKDGYNS